LLFSEKTPWMRVRLIRSVGRGRLGQGCQPVNKVEGLENDVRLAVSICLLQLVADKVVCNQNFGCLGTGLPYAVGASIADGGNQNLDRPYYARFRTWYAEGQQ
jgi:hypothetical protein